MANLQQRNKNQIKINKQGNKVNEIT